MNKVPEFEMNDPLFHFYNKDDVKDMRRLVEREAVFAQEYVNEQAEKGFSPEFAGVLAGLGGAVAGAGIAVPVVGTFLAGAGGAAGAAFAGLNAAGIAGGLAAAGGGAAAAGGAGMAGGIGAVAAGAAEAGAVGAVGLAAAAVALPAVLVGGAVFVGMNQAKLKKTLKELIRLSFVYEIILQSDEREEVRELVAYTRRTRNEYIM